MGTTCSALHIPSSGLPNDLRALVAEAYEKLAWNEATEGARTALLVGAPSDAFVTIVDSACETMDDGTLKELAIALSAHDGGLAVVTSILDGDSFEVLWFAQGKQVDAVTSDNAAEVTLVCLSQEARAAFLKSRFTSGTGGLPEAGVDLIAEDALAAWCTAIGLDPSKAFLRTADLAPEEIATSLVLKRGAVPHHSGRPLPVLQHFHDNDDCPHHRVYPGAWPIPTTRSFGAKWIILSSSAGFDGLNFEISVSETRGTMTLERVQIDAYPFYSGQITSPTPVASAEIPVDETLKDGLRNLLCPEFSVPDVDPESRKYIAILFRPEFRAMEGAAARLDLHVTPHAVGAERVTLPAMRLNATVTDWQPYGVDASVANITKERALFLLNEPSVLSCVSILQNDSDATRADMQHWAEAWLARFAPPHEATAHLRTEKHMTASGSIAKNRTEAALDKIAEEKLWRRAFATKSDLQSIFLEVLPRGSFLPVAGCILQFSLRPEQENENVPSAPHFAVWMIDHPAAWVALGTTPEELESAFRDWMAKIGPLQAGIERTAWIPEFDRYTDYAETPLEQLSPVDWFRNGKRGELMRNAWCRQTLRFLAPQMWLADTLMDDRVELHKLEQFASLERQGATTHLRLNADAALADLETALLEILP